MINNNSANAGAVEPVGRCPQCSQPARLGPSNPARPFCCERCRQLDFGAWIAERYAIEARDDEAPSPQDHPLQ